jgi:hypothetical protein
VHRGRVGNGYVKIDERLLMADEISHFQRLIEC